VEAAAGPALPAAGACPGVGAVEIAPFAIIMPAGCGLWDGADAPGKPDEVDPCGVLLREGRLALALGGARLFRAGSERFVDKLMISFP